MFSMSNYALYQQADLAGKLASKLNTRACKVSSEWSAEVCQLLGIKLYNVLQPNTVAELQVSFNWLWNSLNLVLIPLYDLHEQIRPTARGLANSMINTFILKVCKWVRFQLIAVSLKQNEPCFSYDHFPKGGARINKWRKVPYSSFMTG